MSTTTYVFLWGNKKIILELSQNTPPNEFSGCQKTTSMPCRCHSGKLVLEPDKLWKKIDEVVAEVSLADFSTQKKILNST